MSFLDHLQRAQTGAQTPAKPQGVFSESTLAGRVELCEAAVVVGGKTLTPDATKGYVVFEICHSFPSVTACGTCLHPAVIAANYASMQDQVFNLGHRMAAYLTPEQKQKLPASEQRDMMLGSIVAVEFPEAPQGGWKFSSASPAPCIRAAAVIHKQSEAAALVERNQDKWSVSQEINYRLQDSGFLIMEPEKVKPAEYRQLLAGTPEDIKAQGLGYVACYDAPQALMDCYDPDQRKVAGTWEGSKVVLMKGGIAGVVHWMGVGYVRMGAEREAAITTLLLEDNDPWAPLRRLVADLEKSSTNLLTAISKDVARSA